MTQMVTLTDNANFASMAAAMGMGADMKKAKTSSVLARLKIDQRCRDFNPGRLAFAREFQPIANKILKELRELDRIPLDGRKIPQRYFSPGLLNLNGQIRNRVPGGFLEVNGNKRRLFPADL